MVRASSGDMNSTELQRLLERCWTINDLSEVFRVSGMTIHNWRTFRGLPALVIPGDSRPALRFIPNEVLKWAKDNDVKVYSRTVHKA